MVVDIGAQVGKQGRLGIVEIVVDLDLARLLGDEDSPVGREAECGRLLEVAEGDRVLEARREGGLSTDPRRGPEQQGTGKQRRRGGACEPAPRRRAKLSQRELSS